MNWCRSLAMLALAYFISYLNQYFISHYNSKQNFIEKQNSIQRSWFIEILQHAMYYSINIALQKYIYIYIIIPSINQIKITTLMMIHYVDYWFWNVSVGEWWRIIECKHNLQRWWPSQMVLIITIITCFWNLWLISIIIFRMVIVRIIIFFFLKKHAIWYETLGTRTNDKTSIFLSSNSFIESIRLIWKSNEEDSKSLFIYFVSQMYFHLEYYFMKYLQR